MYQLGVKTKKGFVATSAVLVFGALLFAYFTLSLQTDFAIDRSSGLLRDSFYADYMSDMCIEEAMDIIWNNNSFTGSGSVIQSAYSCGYLVTNTGGVTRQIVASSTVGDVVSNLRVNVVDIDSVITPTEWVYY